MKLLLTLDSKNYTDSMPVLEKTTVRAVIVRDGRLAMQKSRKGEFKIPGGGVEPGESYRDALLREVREETGFQVVPESIAELGEILELREDVFCCGRKYVCHSYFYQCGVREERMKMELTESEQEQGYDAVWETPEVIVRENRQLQEGREWRQRDTEFLAMVLEGKVKVGGL